MICLPVSWSSWPVGSSASSSRGRLASARAMTTRFSGLRHVPGADRRAGHSAFPPPGAQGVFATVGMNWNGAPYTSAYSGVKNPFSSAA